MDNQKLISAALVGGFVSAIFFAIPFLNMINCFCCIGIMAGGAVGLLYFDRTDNLHEYISQATAINVGLASGIAGAFIAVLIDLLIYSIFGDWELEFLHRMILTLEDVPEMTEMLEDMVYEMEQETSRGMHMGRIMFELIRNLILLPIFSLIGSLILRVFLNKNRQMPD